MKPSRRSGIYERVLKNNQQNSCILIYFLFFCGAGDWTRAFYTSAHRVLLSCTPSSSTAMLGLCWGERCSDFAYLVDQKNSINYFRIIGKNLKFEWKMSSELFWGGYWGLNPELCAPYTLSLSYIPSLFNILFWIYLQNCSGQPWTCDLPALVFQVSRFIHVPPHSSSSF